MGKVVKWDRDFQILEETAQRRRYEDRVRGLFYEMDLDTSGEVSWVEFSEALANPHFEAYLSFIELDTSNLFDVFQLLDGDHNNTIALDEFLKGLPELKGPATKVQIKRLHNDV